MYDKFTTVSADYLEPEIKAGLDFGLHKWDLCEAWQRQSACDWVSNNLKVVLVDAFCQLYVHF